MTFSLKSPSLLRVGLLFGVLIGELLVISTWLDGADLVGQSGLAGQIGVVGASVLKFLVGFAAAFAAFAGLQGNFKLPDAQAFGWPWLVLHVAAASLFGGLSASLYGHGSAPVQDLVTVSWIVAGLLALSALALAFYPLSALTLLFRTSGAASLYAAGVSGLGLAVVGLSQSMWQSAANLTFQLVQLILRPVLPDLIVQPERMRLQGHTFGVIINQECSGLEGVGLMLAFSVVWLWLYRSDFLFPRSLLLLPAGVVAVYLLNAVRIAALLLLGDAGAPQIAAGGFHSQAGWIAFNGVALGMTLLVPRMRWFSRNPAVQPAAPHSENPTAAYLIPFLAILATGMFTRAASANFEWLYGLRFFAVAIALWIFRHQLSNLDWRSGWWGPTAGVSVFAIWLGFDRLQAIPTSAIPAALAAGSGAAQTLWIMFRALAAITTVPIAEELAFRGCLMRRVSSADFETISLRSTTWFGVAVSSILFGLLHGDRWIAGILAGLAFAWVARHTNRIGEAIAAHATTNALLAWYVLYFGQWQYW